MTCDPEQIDRLQKTQVVRALDMVFIGPLMIIGGYDLRQRRPILGELLSYLGAGTIIYNATNFWRVERALEREKRRR